MLYTDGLVEARDRPIDEGLQKLCAAVGADDPAIVCRTVMHNLIGNRPAIDDVAVLVLRRATSASS